MFLSSVMAGMLALGPVAMANTGAAEDDWLQVEGASGLGGRVRKAEVREFYKRTKEEDYEQWVETFENPGYILLCIGVLGFWGKIVVERDMETIINRGLEEKEKALKDLRAEITAQKESEIEALRESVMEEVRKEMRAEKRRTGPA